MWCGSQRGGGCIERAVEALPLVGEPGKPLFVADGHCRARNAPEADEKTASNEAAREEGAIAEGGFEPGMGTEHDVGGGVRLEECQGTPASNRKDVVEPGRGRCEGWVRASAQALKPGRIEEGAFREDEDALVGPETGGERCDGGDFAVIVTSTANEHVGQAVSYDVEARIAQERAIDHPAQAQAVNPGKEGSGEEIVED